jgi:hypothetical protein
MRYWKGGERDELCLSKNRSWSPDAEFFQLNCDTVTTYRTVTTEANVYVITTKEWFIYCSAWNYYAPIGKYFIP